MQVETYFENFVIQSRSDGAAQTYTTKPTGAVLNAKLCVVFLDVLQLADNAKIVVVLEDSADGINWRTIGAIIDTSVGDVDAEVALYGDASIENLGAFARFKLVISEREAGSLRIDATVNLKAVWKPY